MYMHMCTVLFIHFSLLYKVAIVNFFSNKRFIIIITISLFFKLMYEC